MSSKGKVVYGSSLRGWTLTIIILCAVVSWASAAGTPRSLTPVFRTEAFAQDAAPTGLRISAHSSSRSLESEGSNKAPYLVIGMAERWDTRPYGSFQFAGDQATNPSTGNTKTWQIGSAVSSDRAKKTESGPLVLSSARDSTAGVQGLMNFREEPTSPPQTSQRSPDLAGIEVYSLLDDRSAPESFLYGYKANYFPSKQRLANNEFFTREVVQAPRSLFELEFGGWRLPVMLTGTAVSR